MKRRATPAQDLAFWLTILMVATLLCCCQQFCCTAHAGQVATVATSIRHTRRTTRITVLRPVRAEGRARAGYPFLQTTANVTRIGVNLSGLINPIGWFF